MHLQQGDERNSSSRAFHKIRFLVLIFHLFAVYVMRDVIEFWFPLHSDDVFFTNKIVKFFAS